MAPSLVLVLDGLRPDYVDPDLLPTLAALADRGVTSTRHHAVFPSETRVQAASIATGCFPAGHGLVNNALRLPAIRDGPFDTGDAEQLLEIDEQADGGLLSARSLGEVLASHDRTLFAAGSCTTGANFLLNHTAADEGVFNARGFVAPAGKTGTVERTVGPFSDPTIPNTAQHRWAVDAYLDVGLGEGPPPDVGILWLSDPDLSMHAHGVGYPQVLEGLRALDGELGRLFGTLRDRGVLESTNVFVLGDHGFSTDVGDLDVSGVLADRGLGDDATVVAGTQVSLNDPDESRGPIVRALQETDGVGAVFTRDGLDSDGSDAVPGTFPLESVHLDHDRAAHVVVAPDWSDRSNEHGYPGTTSRRGGGHGTLSPHEMRVHLLAAGPDLKGDGVASDVPTGHVDLAPTLLHLLDLDPPPSMHGRVLHELLEGGPDPDALRPSDASIDVASDDGSGYAATLERIRVEEVTYPVAAHVDRSGP